jgi:hypothetical protein
MILAAAFAAVDLPAVQNGEGGEVPWTALGCAQHQ